MNNNPLLILRNLPQRLPYPEVLVSIGILIFLTIHNHSPNALYEFFAIGLLVLSAVFLAVSIGVSASVRRQYLVAFDLANIVVFSLVIGLLQLNFFPTICLWLLLFYRFMVSKKQYIIAYIVVGVLLVGISYFTSLTVLPRLTLTLEYQTILNEVSVFLTAITFALQLWYLLLLAQHFRQNAYQQQEKITRWTAIANKLTRFLPPQIWQPIIRTNQPVSITNQRKKLTILFSDIAGFTELSDTLSSDNLADILNTYLDTMTRIAQKHGATLDKFIGDGMLCFFGDQHSEGERSDALKCVAMAIEMRQAMRVLRNQWRLLGFDGLHVRIGINTGYCHVGNFGSSNRMSYTVIGKEANLASRLEASAEKSQILISESTFDLICHEYPCQMVGEMLFKGFKVKQPVWEVLDPNEGNHQDTEWLNYTLEGFNLHLNFKDIKNYDERTIRRSLNHALEMLEKQSKNPAE